MDRRLLDERRLPAVRIVPFLASLPAGAARALAAANCEIDYKELMRANQRPVQRQPFNA